LPKKGSEEYLNYQFGLKPTANDLEKMALAVTQFHKVVNQMKRDSDLTVRRRLDMGHKSGSSEFTDTLSSKSVLIPRMGAVTKLNSLWGSSSPSGPTLISYSWSVEKWFSGAFTYHLADAHSFLSRIERYDQLANQLLGTRITPSVIWELTPWSWLIDWVSDAGTFFKNVSLLTDDSLVLRYGYMMHHTVMTNQYRVKLTPRANCTGLPAYAHSTRTTEVKSRIRSTPYGFGLDTSLFSVRKWSILAALGMTKGDKKLRYLD